MNITNIIISKPNIVLSISAIVYTPSMYITFIETFEKLAEERPSKLKRLANTALNVSPWILGFGAGGVAQDLLRNNINKVTNPTLKTMARVAMPLAGGALSYMILPKIQEKFKKDLMGNFSEPSNNEPSSQPATSSPMQ